MTNVEADDDEFGREQSDPSMQGAIAIVGVAGRFPKAKTIGQFWQNLVEGRDCVTHFAAHELEDCFDDETRCSDAFVKARPIVDDVELFDAEFFGMFSREAALTDPQHRLFLECAWEVLESAGYDPAAYPGAIGVFAGCSLSTYLLNHVCTDRSVVERIASDYQLGSFPILIGSIQDVLATRVAYKLDLRGPAVTLGSACSTSAVAIVQACQSLMLYQADMAIAGGVSVSFPQKRGYMYLEGGMGAEGGVCRPFDANARGTIFGSGCGAVLLKRLEDAIADRDHIYAVVRGFGINNDGGNKVGFTAPSVDGQSACIAAAHAMADIDAGTIGYVEGHGTATPLGDPIEFAALKQAFQGSTARRGYCAIGSSKANIGHLDAAAGVTGLIKAALCLDSKMIPPLANFETPNPALDVENSPFYFPKSLQPWECRESPRRAGVSSFGVGGTNVHIVLEEAPARAIEVQDDAIDRPHVLPLAARSETALAAMRTALADHITATPDVRLADIAFTLQSGRKPFAYRSAVVARSADEAVRQLRAAPAITGNSADNFADGGAGAAFMFPGQGAQYPGMGRALYESEPIFRDVVDQGDEILRPVIGESMVSLLYGETPTDDEAPHPIRSTILAQPALFIIEHAVARLWMSYGVTPTAMIGHSVGEFVAACLAGVFSYEDGLKLIAARGRLMQSAPGGAMLAVRADEAAVRGLLSQDSEIAAINAPNLCVVAGPFAAIDALEARLELAGLIGRRLHTSHAFHSAMMDPVVPALADVVAGMRLNAPEIPYISCVSGTWITAAQATDPSYWAGHCRATVRFADGIAVLRENGDVAMIECGPGRTLATFAAQSPGKAPNGRRRAVITSMPEFADAERCREHFLEALARSWCDGSAISWSRLEGAGSRRVPLPTYPFERSRHWIDAPASASRSGTGVPSAAIQQAAAPAVATGAMNAASLGSDACSMPTAAVATAVVATTTVDQSVQQENDNMSERERALGQQVLRLLEKLSGASLDSAALDTSFVELGFDSLFLGQLATEVNKAFGVKIAFRKLLREYPSATALAAHLAATLPASAAPPPIAADGGAAPLAPTAPVAQAVAVTATAPVAVNPNATATVTLQKAPQPIESAVPGAASSSLIETVLRDQMTAMQQLMSRQLDLLQGTDLRQSAAVAATPPADARPVATNVEAGSPHATTSPAPAVQVISSGDAGGGAERSRFDAYKLVKGGKDTRGTTPAQEKFISSLIQRYNARTASSKSFTQQHRKVLADPRTANGFRSEWKEMVYPLVCPRSKGSKIWDLDGNEYVDLVNGYGPIAFGHAPEFVTKVVAEQLEKGFAIGPQSPLAGEVADLFVEMTGNERVTFCNTGSEAVMAAMRLSRAVTGRSRIVTFAGAYHGQFDEVIVKGNPKGRAPGANPAASGIPPELVSNIIVLPYGTPESLEFIRAHAGDLAAVLVETVQSRRPGFLPEAFLRELREITATSGAALIFDEVVTGFRVHPGGMQSYLGIRADLATYGKVVGGGLPVGALAGKAEFMDALDGGHWQYGDDTVPEVAPTFFAGTFVRHPLVLVAMKAVLEHLKAEGPALQERLAERTRGLVGDIRAAFARRGINASIETFSSYFHIDLSGCGPLAALFYPLMRLNGIHMQEGFLGFLTTAHSDADLALIVRAVERSLDELVAAGILGAGDVGAVALAAPATTTKPKPAMEPAPAAAALAATACDECDAALPVEQVVPLTEVQREIWMAAQMGDRASCAFNESASLRLEGAVDVDVLIEAVNDVVGRHDALRASFGATGERMRVASAVRLDVALVDFSRAPDPQADFAALIAADAATPFDLANGPCARAIVVKVSETQSILVFTAHHIVCDGWSMNIIMSELSSFYDARKRGSTAALAPALSYCRYARDEAAKGGADADVEAFWLEQYKTVPAWPELPSDRPRPERRTYGGATYCDQIDRDLYRQVKQAGAREGCTLFVTLFAAFQVLIGRLAQHDDVVVAVPMAGQSLVDDGDTLVGHCVNFLPLRVPFAFDTAFSRHLKSVNEHAQEAFDRQDYTLGTLVRRLALPRDMNRLPLTELQFNLEKIGGNLEFADLEASIGANPKSFSNFDIFFNVIESAVGLRIECDYNTDILDRDTIARWVSHYCNLLREVVANADQPIGAIPLLSEQERTWLIDDLNKTACVFPVGATAHRLISDQAKRVPANIAVQYADATMTYAELEDAANRMSRHLSRLLPAPGSRVAVALDRSPDMLVTLLAIMKSGHAYVPLDPDHPEERLRLVLETARPAALVCNRPAIADLAPSGCALVHIDRDRGAIAAEASMPPACADASPADPAYVIFTSGSTGTPKGVEVPHRALTNFLLSMQASPGFSAEDTIVAVTTVSFDIAVLELLLPLVAGGRVVIASRDDVKGGFGLVDLIASSGATMLQATPSLWRILLEAGFRPRSGLKMLCGGEPLPRDLADALVATGGELWNMYGPTETTVWSSMAKVGTGPIVIGEPIANTQLHILDQRDQVQPIGIPGQLHIGGNGLANGYFDRPDLTQNAFVEIALARRGTSRLYRTGDLAVRRADGSIDLLGRIDQQVKLRGFRIELGEIEAAIRAVPGVTDAAVALRSVAGKDPRLVGYYVLAENSRLATSDLSERLTHALPDYMVPTAWKQLDRLPMTPNGKLDRKALPDVEQAGVIVRDVPQSLPSTPTEIALAAIWQDVLGLESIGVHDGLFSLGADSLQVFRIAARFGECGIKLQAKHLLEHPTIAELAAFADAQVGGDAAVGGKVASLREFRHGARRRGLIGGAA